VKKRIIEKRKKEKEKINGKNKEKYEGKQKKTK